MENYEQKYKKALSFLKDLRPHMSDYCIEKLEGFFPELKESEDEKIRKDCIKYLNWEHQACSINEDKIKIEKCVTWLEKQCEQKLTDKVEPEFKVGDWIINNDKRIAVPTQILKIEEYGYGTSRGYTSFDKVKTDYHLWTIKDAHVGDVLYHKSPLTGIEYIVMNRGVNGCGNIDSYFRYNSVDGFDISVPSVLSTKSDDITPATKEQRDLLFQKMHEAGYEWDAEKKELKKIEHNHIWSEEDEKMKSLIISTLISMGTLNLERYHNMNLDEVKNWLKSLKPRWKPSEEQMEALKYEIKSTSENSWQRKECEKLYNDLQKL